MALTPDNSHAYVVDFYGPTVSVVDLGKNINPDDTTPSLPPAILPIINQFFIPTLGTSINFAVDNTYINATLNNNTWIFTDLCIAGSPPFEHFEILTQNADMTIFSCATVRTLEYQSIKLKYAVEGEGKQVLNFGSLPEEGGRVEWSVTCDNVSLTEDIDWSISDNDDDKTITVNNAKGEVIVIRYYFSDSLDKPDLTFIKQHSVSIVIGTALVAILTIAVFIKIKNREHAE
jgi:hypothetical protein